MSFYSELKRRNVFRAAIAYLALAWLLTEVAGTLFPVFGIPDWGVRFVVIVLALGFVAVLVVSWIYELTPEGIKREQDVVREESSTHVTARRLDLFTIAIIIVALGFILTDRLWLTRKAGQWPELPSAVLNDSAQTPGPDPTEPQYPPKAVAWLPFVNMSGDAEKTYLSEKETATKVLFVRWPSRLNFAGHSKFQRGLPASRFPLLLRSEPRVIRR